MNFIDDQIFTSVGSDPMSVITPICSLRRISIMNQLRLSLEFERPIEVINICGESKRKGDRKGQV